jgi:hypothetical protein
VRQYVDLIREPVQQRFVSKDFEIGDDTKRPVSFRYRINPSNSAAEVIRPLIVSLDSGKRCDRCLDEVFLTGKVFPKNDIEGAGQCVCCVSF